MHLTHNNVLVVLYTKNWCNNMTYESVFNFDNLYKSYKRCIKGVMWKTSTQNYKFHAVKNISKSLKQITDNSYKHKKYNEFIIKARGKQRNIKSVHINDRVVQKCFTENCLMPLLRKKLIYDSGACLTGKGMKFSTNRLKCHLQKYFRQNKSNKGYILIFDYSKFFESIDHEILLNKLSNVIQDKRLLEYYKSTIENKLGKGLSLGSDMSQIVGLYFISEVDHYIKTVLKANYYGRYMDDAYIIHGEKETLKQFLIKIQKLSLKLKLNLNANKTQIRKIDKGFIFLNRHWILTDKNYVKTRPTHNTMARIKRKYNKLIKMNITEKQLAEFKSSINGFLKFYKNERMVEYVYN